MPVVAAQRLVTLLEISRMTGVIPDIGPDGKVQVTMEYNGDTPVRITTVVVSVQHKEDTDINKLADLLDKYVFPLAFDGMPAEDAEIILNPSGKFVQGGPDADTGLTGRKLMVDSYGTFAPHGGGAFSGKDATKVDRSGAYMARFYCQKHCSSGLCPALSGHAGVCHRAERPCYGGGKHLWHRHLRGRLPVGRCAQGV